MKYQTILTIKESEKVTVELAAVEMFVGPVIVKQLKGGNPDIYRILFSQNNSHIPRVYAVEVQDGDLLVAEEYVDGESLGEHLQKNLLSDEQKLNYALQLCEAVGFLHALNPTVIHRDIKLSNILINGKGELKLIDFDASRQYKNFSNEEDTRLLGTRGYAPPEQFGYAQTDVRSDIYSMGVVFHKMCPLKNELLAKQWDEIAEKCTSFDPKNRYQNVAELERELEKLATGKKRRKAKLTAWLGSIVLFLTVVALVVVLWPKKKEAGEIGGVTLTSAPTSMPAEVPTMMPTSMPTEVPTMIPTMIPTILPTETPEPTLEPTPTILLTPTPEPTATLAPVDDGEQQNRVAEIVTELENQNNYINTFYKELDINSDFMEYSALYEGDAFTFLEIQVLDLETGNHFLIPEDCFYKKNSVLHIKGEYLRRWKAGCYRLYVVYEDEKNSLDGTITMYIQVFEGADVTERGMIFENNFLDFYYEYYNCVHTIVANDVVGSFKDIGNYRLLENGRVIEFDKEFLLQHIIPGESGVLEFELELEDGRKDRMKIQYLTGKPSYIK